MDLVDPDPDPQHWNLVIGGDDPHRALADISLEDLDWPAEKV